MNLDTEGQTVSQERGRDPTARGPGIAAPASDSTFGGERGGVHADGPLGAIAFDRVAESVAADDGPWSVAADLDRAEAGLRALANELDELVAMLVQSAGGQGWGATALPHALH